jgi:parvulin-like peptidyl-prolyl isomerase
MDEGPVAMSGSDSRPVSASRRRAGQSRRSAWWLLGTAAAVMVTGVATRMISLPRAIAQAPVVRAGSPAAPARPTAAQPGTPQPVYQPAGQQALPPASQQQPAAVASRPASPQTLPPAKSVQPTAAMSKSTALPPSTTLQVMAVVNGEQINRQELGRECIRRYGEEVLESMVNRQLIGDACAQKGIVVSDADVSTEIDKVAGRFGLARDRWLTLLREERGFSEEQYRREVLWPMLALRQLVASEIQVTDEDIRKAFESEFGSKVRARLIAVDKQDKAEQVRAQAVADPNSFGELSKKNTIEAGIAAAYGVIPPIRHHLGDADLERVAFALKPGQISEVVHVANMYYILKCEEIMPQQFLSSQQLAEQQARMKEKIKENKLRVSAAEFFEKRKKEANIVVLVTTKSDNDPEKNEQQKNDLAKKQKLQQEMPGVAAIVNGKQLTYAQLADECITRHGSEVLDGEINRKVLQQELNRKRLVVEERDIDLEVERAADAYGFVAKDGKPDKKRWLEQVTNAPGATVDLYVRDAVWPSVALKKLVGTKIDVTDDDLRKGYESNYGERVEAQAIVFSDMRQAQKVWDLARNNNTEPFFAELAQQYSIEPASRSNGGKVPPIRRFGGAPIVEDEAFKLRPGEISGILAVDGQFIMLRCVGRTKPVQTDFSAVRGELAKDIQEKKLRVLMTKEFDRLREVAQIDNFLAGSSQTGGRSAGPVSISNSQPRGGMLPPPAAASIGTGVSRPTSQPMRAGPAPGSATLPRTSGAQAR